MSRSLAPIETVLEPVRSMYIKTFKRELSLARLDGGDIEPEAVTCGKHGAVLRDGVLNLPRRTDVLSRKGDCTATRNFKPAQEVQFDPVDLRINDQLDLTVFPFSWDEVQIRFEAREDPKHLLRLRLWYLEWFLARPDLENEGLKGALHALRGPKRELNYWKICVDLGSAPTEAMVELLRALASRGVDKVVLGAEVSRMEKQDH